MKTIRSKRECWVLEVETKNLKGKSFKQYLHATNGDWGPSHLPGWDIADATEFGSEREATEWARRNWSGAKPVHVTIATIYKIT